MLLFLLPFATVAAALVLPPPPLPTGRFLASMQNGTHCPAECFDFTDICVCQRTAIENDGSVYELDGVVSVPTRVINITELNTNECAKRPPWHLSSISNPSHRVDRPYPYEITKQEIVYVVDSWVETTHPDFSGRAQVGVVLATGKNHHGTHVAGLVGSSTYGVNKNAKIISVVVLDENGQGAWSTIVEGLHWISRQKQRGIINMSLSGVKSATIDSVIRAMVKDGWKFVVAAGNSNEDACRFSPANLDSVVTVGATDSSVRAAGFSNHGKCVTMHAPGESILSTYPPNLAAYMSGTSMAAPIVAGIWALKPWLTQEELLVEYGAYNRVTNLKSGTANVYSYIRSSPNNKCS